MISRLAHQFFRFATCVAILLSADPSFSQAFNEDGFVHLAKEALIAEDVQSEWTAEDVAAGKYDAQFLPVTDPIPNLNFTTSTFWMKLSFTNEEAEQHYFLECARPITNEVRFYELNESAELSAPQISGDEIRFSKRPVQHRNILFDLEVPSGESKTILLAMRSDGEVITSPLKLWKQEALHAFTQRENLFLGIYYGLLIFVLIIFGFFALVLKQRVYTFYVAYIFSLMLMQASLDGTAFQNLWPSWPWMANHSVLIFSSVSVLMMMMYAASFLQIRSFPKTYSRIYLGLGSIVSLCILTSFLSGTPYELTFPIINGTSFLVLLLIIAGIFMKASTGQKVNRFFAIAFISVLSGGLLFITGNFGLYFNEFLTANAIKLGSAAEVVFLSLAMAGRYQDVQREKEAAQKEAYEHLEALNLVTKDQNIRLEKQVAERTAEIKEKSEQLEEKNKEIIDSITYAKRIQAAILPSDDYFHTNLENAFVLYLPKDIVAGDFYWMKRVGAWVLFAAADCTGHGVPGAMVSVICNNALNRAVREFGLHEPAAILDMVASLVEEAFQQSSEEVKDGMDISLCALNRETRELSWAGANNPIWVVSSYQLSAISEAADSLKLKADSPSLQEIKADKQPIGKFSDRKLYTQHQLHLSEGDTLYIFSDGFADQFGGPKGKKYKSKAFKEFLMSIREKAMSEQRDALHHEFQRWRGNLEQVDDVCIIGLRI